MVELRNVYFIWGNIGPDTYMMPTVQVYSFKIITEIAKDQEIKFESIIFQIILNAHYLQFPYYSETYKQKNTSLNINGYLS